MSLITHKLHSSKTAVGTTKRTITSNKGLHAASNHKQFLHVCSPSPSFLFPAIHLKASNFRATIQSLKAFSRTDGIVVMAPFYKSFTKSSYSSPSQDVNCLKIQNMLTEGYCKETLERQLKWKVLNFLSPKFE